MNQVMEATREESSFLERSARAAPPSGGCEAVLVEAFDTGTARERADSVFLEAVSLYRSGHCLQAFDILARLADEGHAPAAKLSLLMLRYGRSLYGATFEAAPVRVARWARCVLATRALPAQ